MSFKNFARIGRVQSSSSQPKNCTPLISWPNAGLSFSLNLSTVKSLEVPARIFGTRLSHWGNLGARGPIHAKIYFTVFDKPARARAPARAPVLSRVLPRARAPAPAPVLPRLLPRSRARAREREVVRRRPLVVGRRVNRARDVTELLYVTFLKRRIIQK